MIKKDHWKLTFQSKYGGTDRVRGTLCVSDEHRWGVEYQVEGRKDTRQIFARHRILSMHVIECGAFDVEENFLGIYSNQYTTT